MMNRDFIFHAGDRLEDFMDERHITPVKLHRKNGLSMSEISHVCA